MKRYEVYIERRRGSDLQIVEADSFDTAAERALANVEAASARVIHMKEIPL